MPDVLLIQPPIHDFYLTAKRTVPYGLACIAAALDRQGISVMLLDALATRKVRPLPWPANLHYLQAYYGRPDRSPMALFHAYRHYGYSFEHIAQQARACGAPIVGIASLFTPYARQAFDTAAAVKKTCPDAIIVLGGHHPTTLPEHALSHPAVDFVLRGEGEAAMPAFVQAYRNGVAPDAVPGIGYRRSDGSLCINPPACMTAIDAYPAPAPQWSASAFYRRNHRRTCVVTASRGCPMPCSYCCIGKTSAIPYRRRSIAAVLAEIDAVLETGEVGFIDFEDENLALDHSWFNALLTGLIQRNPRRSIELRAMNGLFPPSLNADLIRLMHRAGFRSLNLALASICPEQLKRFNRPDVRRTFDAALAAARRTGMDAVGYIIIGAPGQKADDSMADLRYLAERRVLAGVSVFYPAPGSADYRRCKTLHLLPDDPALLRGSVLPVDHTTSRLQTVTLLRLGRLVNFIKALHDQGEVVPPPEAYNGRRFYEDTSRLEIGKKLLQWFRADAIIRGVTPQGDVYRHRADARLAELFQQYLEDPTRIQGVHGI